MLPVLIIATFKLYVWANFIRPPAPLADTAMTPHQARQALSIASSILKEAGVKVIVKKFKVIRSPFPISAYRTEWQVNGLWGDLYQYAYDRHMTGRHRTNYWFTPRSLEGYMIGMTLFPCAAKSRDGSISYSTAEAQNLAGENRRIHTAIGTAHELLRAAGAKTSLGNDIMNVSALAIYSNQGYIDIADQSRNEIRQCFSGVKR